ncbi:hypothetical protein ISN45_Aa04g004830 [Arabidopsis thaliana x Arabidopsis arenosa]|uniref:KIB1-4 beta-propeller domain-containing protein n=1 Tax=Arabidopsis thaliana x Arabidopsis arenosa TaxID=1240361 RepID=A0A8T2A355_9BRAS|nr:hypothetical protein ISN45_Aa04g004830 [Arabidopsis thaliana x Arabidopsis arenosa]
MLSMLALFAPRGDPHSPFLLLCYAQVTLFPRKFPRKSKSFCTLKKVPLFLFRVRALATAAASPSEFFLEEAPYDKSKDHMELLPSPLQCSVRVKIPGSEPTLMNMLDCQILPLGNQYRIIGWDPEEQTTVFLPLNKDGGEGGGEFVVLLNYSYLLLALTSSEMRWKLVMDVPNTSCTELVTFRGRFYAAFLHGEVCVIDPCSLEATSLIPSEPLCSSNYLIPSGNDELFLVTNTVVCMEMVIYSSFGTKLNNLFAY